MIWHDAGIILVMLLLAYLDRRRVLKTQEEFHRVELAGRDRTIQQLTNELAAARRELNDYKRRAA